MDTVWMWLSAGRDWLHDSGIHGHIKNWETLVAGLIAFAGAVLAWRAVRSQVRQTDTMARDNRAREERAAMVVLPLALADLSQYATECIRVADAAMMARRRRVELPRDLPAVPVAATPALQECARHANDKIVDQIATVMSMLQVLQSRMQRLVQLQRVAEVECLDRMRDGADLHAALATLFEYSRRDGRPASHADLVNSLHIADIRAEDHPIWQHIAPRR